MIQTQSFYSIYSSEDLDIMINFSENESSSENETMNLLEELEKFKLQ